jgi:ATP-dependent Lon protease
MDLLTNSIAPGAFHDSRVAVLEHIMSWTMDFQQICFFMWLYGPAGTGKSAIVQSIAELYHKADLLAASFFFSRTAVGRNDGSRLIPTLVC